MTLAAVSDAGPLIHLAEIDSVELLETFDTFLVPETVYKEVDAPEFVPDHRKITLNGEQRVRDTGERPREGGWTFHFPCRGAVSIYARATCCSPQIRRVSRPE